MSFRRSLEVLIDALTGHLLDTLDDSLGGGLDLLVFILKKFGEERDSVVEDNQVAFSHGLKEVLDQEESGLSRLPLLTSGLHQDSVVQLRPHGVIVDPFIHLEH